MLLPIEENWLEKLILIDCNRYKETVSESSQETELTLFVLMQII